MPADPVPNSDDARTIEVIELEAADWLVLHDRGLTVAQQKEFSAWLAVDPRHAEIFAELEETWTRLAEARDESPELTQAAAASRATAVPAHTRRRSKLLWWSVPLAAAAALALVYLAQTPPPVAVVDGFATTAETQVGGLRKLTLPDGSLVQLNTDSAVTVHYTTAERRVSLVRGEAHFQVTKNPARPFIVSASGVAVRAVGTAFDVRMRPESIEVLVTEGRVRLNDTTDGKSLLPFAVNDGAEPLLEAGQRAVVPLAGATPAAVAAVPTTEMGQALAWQSRQLEFAATPLAEVVAEFNRYNRHKLVIADPRLATQRFGGTFPVDDTEALVRLLEANFGVVAERGERETKLRLAP